MFRSYLRQLRNLDNIPRRTTIGLATGMGIGGLGSLTVSYLISNSSFKEYLNKISNSTVDDSYLIGIIFLGVLVGGFLGGALGYYTPHYLRKPKQ